MSYVGRVCAEVGHAAGNLVPKPDTPTSYTPEEVLAVKAVRRALAAWGVPKGSLGERETQRADLPMCCSIYSIVNESLLEDDQS